MTINCNAVADRSVKSSPYLSLKTLVLLLTLCLGFVATAQDDTYEGGNLDEVTVTEDEARSLIKQLIDVDRFLHSFGVQKIAKDEALVAYAEGFVERNSIEVLTIGYIDSEEFWPRIFKNIRLKKIDKANTDLLLTGHIMFIPIMGTDGSISGYTVELKLEGKTTQVYELLEVSQTDIELIAQETTTERLGDKPYTTPADAQREVADAMIAALQKVEGKGDTTDQNIQLVSFQADPNQKFGFDAPQHTQLNNDYPTVTVGGSSSRTSWKSLKSNSTDQVIAISAGDQDLTFELDGAPVIATAGDNNTYNLSLMGNSDGVTGELLAKVGTATAGKLNTITYDLSEIKVKIVPVNNAISPSELSLLQDTLNKIYAPAIASWHVEVLENQNLGTDWDDEGNGLEDGETGMLSNYTKEMNDLIKAFKDKNDRDKDAYYVFLVDHAENSGKQGYMPRKKQWGFVFTRGQNIESLTTTIAHELGHGVYRLEHTFTEKGIPRDQTQNLMDYAGGRALYKYQWDYVHNPVSVITLFDDEEEAAYSPYELLVTGLITFKGKFSNFASTTGPYSFIATTGKLITLPAEVEDVSFYPSNGALIAFTINSSGERVRYISSRYKLSQNFAGYRSSQDEAESQAKENIYEDVLSKNISSSATVFLGRPDETEECKLQLFKGSLTHTPPTSEYYGGLDEAKNTDVALSLSKEKLGNLVDSPESCICDKGKEFYDLFSAVITNDTEYNQLTSLAQQMCNLPDNFLTAFGAENDASFQEKLNRWLMWDSDKAQLKEARASFWEREDAWSIYYNQLSIFINKYNSYKNLFDNEYISNRTLKAIVNARTDQFLDLYSIDERIDIIKKLLPEKAISTTPTPYGSGQSVDWSEIYVSNDEEHAIIKVLQSIDSKDEAIKMLAAISSDGFLSELNYHLDDVGLGGNNYTALANEFRRLTLLKNDIPHQINQQTLAHWEQVPDYAHLVYNDKRLFSFGVPAEVGGVFYKKVEYNSQGEMEMEIEVCTEIENFDISYYNATTGTASSYTEQRCVKKELATFKPNYFDLVSIDVINLDYVPADITTSVGSSFITYAGFIDYLLEKKGTKQVITIADYTVTAVTLALGIGEVTLLIRGGATTARIALASYDLGVEVADLVIKSNAFAEFICGTDSSGNPIICNKLITWREANTLAQITAIGASGFDIASNWNLLKAGRSVDDFLGRLRSKFNDAEWTKFSSTFGDNAEALARFDAKEELVNSWKTLHANNASSFVIKDLDRLVVFNKLSDENKALAKLFTDDDASSTLSKFLDDVDGEIIPILNKKPKLIDGFTSHKTGKALSENELRSKYDLIAEELRDLDIPDVQKEKLIYWLDRSSDLSSFGRYSQKGIDFSNNVFTSIATRTGQLFDDLANKLKIDPSVLREYEIYKEVPLLTEGGFMKADLVLVKRGDFGLEEVIVIENKLSSGTDYTIRQKEGWKKLARGEPLVVKSPIVGTNAAGKPVTLASDYSFTAKKVKPYKINDHGDTEIDNVNISEIPVNNWKNYSYKPN
ncbi:hypothetical protein [Marinoscillum pacificum]|uniref:hypothetical protein n=1 Tax=Marinoscillum pacificum TaxID=392723 RepID=UPI00215812E1|nr:hypothetical protein [Marinoscillum pacificum]